MYSIFSQDFLMEMQNGDLIEDLILLKIYSYLPYKFLIDCLCVSKRWNSLVKYSLKMRVDTIKTVLFNFTQNQKFDKNGINKQDFDSIIRDQLDLAFSKPEQILIFRPLFMEDYILHENEDGQSTGRKRLKKSPVTVFDRLNRLLSHLPTFYICSQGVLGSDYKNQKVLEIDDENLDFGLSGLLLPKSDSYLLRTVLCTDSNKQSFANLKDKNDFYKLFGLQEKLLSTSEAGKQGRSRYS
jgi:hypothetical protein